MEWLLVVVVAAGTAFIVEIVTEVLELKQPNFMQKLVAWIVRRMP